MLQDCKYDAKLSQDDAIVEPEHMLSKGLWEDIALPALKKVGVLKLCTARCRNVTCRFMPAVTACTAARSAARPAMLWNTAICQCLHCIDFPQRIIAMSVCNESVSADCVDSVCHC